MNTIHTQHTINGVSGAMDKRGLLLVVGTTGIFRSQKFISISRPIKGYAAGAEMKVCISFDDECQNGHQTFAITAEVRIRRNIEACGCMHEEIAKVFPEFAPLIKWHLVSTDGPVHYIANTHYFVSKLRFDEARRTAVWPEATDEQLSAPREELEAALLARMPSLMSDFYADMEACGFCENNLLQKVLK